VFNGGRRSADRYFTVLYTPNDSDVARLGFAVAKKKIRKAVGRNRIRRLARESFRYECSTLGGVDIVILAQTIADAASNQELTASLQKHWQRIRNGEDSGRPRRSRGKHS
jgi:ribonuclease P protein component